MNQKDARKFRKAHAGSKYGELVSARDIAERYGVVIGTVRSWARRYPEFPAPVAVISGYTRVWDLEEVEKWWKAEKTRSSPRFGEPVMEAS
jgi:transposase